MYIQHLFVFHFTYLFFYFVVFISPICVIYCLLLFYGFLHKLIVHFIAEMKVNSGHFHLYILFVVPFLRSFSLTFLFVVVMTAEQKEAITYAATFANTGSYSLQPSPSASLDSIQELNTAAALVAERVIPGIDDVTHSSEPYVDSAGQKLQSISSDGPILERSASASSVNIIMGLCELQISLRQLQILSAVAESFNERSYSGETVSSQSPKYAFSEPDDPQTPLLTRYSHQKDSYSSTSSHHFSPSYHHGSPTNPVGIDTSINPEYYKKPRNNSVGLDFEDSPSPNFQPQASPNHFSLPWQQLTFCLLYQSMQIDAQLSNFSLCLTEDVINTSLDEIRESYTSFDEELKCEQPLAALVRLEATLTAKISRSSVDCNFDSDASSLPAPLQLSFTSNSELNLEPGLELLNKFESVVKEATSSKLTVDAHCSHLAMIDLQNKASLISGDSTDGKNISQIVSLRYLRRISQDSNHQSLAEMPVFSALDQPFSSSSSFSATQGSNSDLKPTNTSRLELTISGLCLSVTPVLSRLLQLKDQLVSVSLRQTAATSTSRAANDGATDINLRSTSVTIVNVTNLAIFIPAEEKPSINQRDVLNSPSRKLHFEYHPTLCASMALSLNLNLQMHLSPLAPSSPSVTLLPHVNGDSNENAESDDLLDLNQYNSKEGDMWMQLKVSELKLLNLAPLLHCQEPVAAWDRVFGTSRIYSTSRQLLLYPSGFIVHFRQLPSVVSTIAKHTRLINFQVDDLRFQLSFTSLAHLQAASQYIKNLLDSSSVSSTLSTISARSSPPVSSSPSSLPDVSVFPEQWINCNLSLLSITLIDDQRHPITRPYSGQDIPHFVESLNCLRVCGSPVFEMRLSEFTARSVSLSSSRQLRVTLALELSFFCSGFGQHQALLHGASMDSPEPCVVTLTAQQYRPCALMVGSSPSAASVHLSIQKEVNFHLSPEVVTAATCALRQINNIHQSTHLSSRKVAMTASLPSKTLGSIASGSQPLEAKESGHDYEKAYVSSSKIIRQAYYPKELSATSQLSEAALNTESNPASTVFTVHPCEIDNQTELMLWFTPVVAVGEQQSLSEEKRLVQPFQRQSFQFRPSVLPQHRLLELQFDFPTRQVKSPGENEQHDQADIIRLQPVTITVGQPVCSSHPLFLRPPSSSQSNASSFLAVNQWCVLICEVQMRDGITSIQVHSQVGLYNHLVFPLSVKNVSFSSPSSLSASSSLSSPDYVIDKGKLLWLPLSLLANYSAEAPPVPSPPATLSGSASFSQGLDQLKDTMAEIVDQTISGNSASLANQTVPSAIAKLKPCDNTVDFIYEWSPQLVLSHPPAVREEFLNELDGTPFSIMRNTFTKLRWIMRGKVGQEATAVVSSLRSSGLHFITHAHRSERTVTYSSRSESRFCATLHAQTTSGSDNQENLGYTVFHVQAPLVVENLLACPAMVRIFEKKVNSNPPIDHSSEGESSGGDWVNVKRGDRYPVYESQVAAALMAPGVADKGAVNHPDSRVCLMLRLDSLGCFSETVVLDLHSLIEKHRRAKESKFTAAGKVSNSTESQMSQLPGSTDADAASELDPNATTTVQTVALYAQTSEPPTGISSTSGRSWGFLGIRDRRFRSGHRCLLVNVECSIVRGQVQVVLYASHWLFDCTRLQLNWSLDKSPELQPPSKASAELQGYATNRDPLERIPIRNPDDVQVAVMFGVDPVSRVKSHTFGVYMRSERFRTAWTTSPIRLNGTVGTDYVSILGPEGSSGCSRAFEVGISVESGPGRYRRTAMVTFIPRFVVMNQLDVPILIRQYRRTAANDVSSSQNDEDEPRDYPTALCVDAKGARNFHWFDSDARRLLSFTALDKVSRRSGFFNIDQVNLEGIQTPLCIRSRSQPQNYWLARVDIRIKGKTVFVVVDKYPTHPEGALLRSVPFVVENRSVFASFRFRQLHPAHDSISAGHVGVTDMRVERDRPWKVAPPYSTFPFAFDEPLEMDPDLEPLQRANSIRPLVEVLIGFANYASVTVGSPVKSDTLSASTASILIADGGGATYSHRHYVDLTNSKSSWTIKVPVPESASGSYSTSTQSFRTLYLYVESRAFSSALVISDFPADKNLEDESEHKKRTRLSYQRIKQLTAGLHELNQKISAETAIIQQHASQLEKVKTAPERPAGVPDHESRLLVHVYRAIASNGSQHPFPKEWGSMHRQPATDWSCVASVVAVSQVPNYIPNSPTASFSSPLLASKQTVQGQPIVEASLSEASSLSQAEDSESVMPLQLFTASLEAHAAARDESKKQQQDVAVASSAPWCVEFHSAASNLESESQFSFLLDLASESHDSLKAFQSELEAQLILEMFVKSVPNKGFSISRFKIPVDQFIGTAHLNLAELSDFQPRADIDLQVRPLQSSVLPASQSSTIRPLSSATENPMLGIKLQLAAWLVPRGPRTLCRWISEAEARRSEYRRVAHLLTTELQSITQSCAQAKSALPLNSTFSGLATVRFAVSVKYLQGFERLLNKELQLHNSAPELKAADGNILCVVYCPLTKQQASIVVKEEWLHFSQLEFWVPRLLLADKARSSEACLRLSFYYYPPLVSLTSGPRAFKPLFLGTSCTDNLGAISLTHSSSQDQSSGKDAIWQFQFSDNFKPNVQNLNSTDRDEFLLPVEPKLRDLQVAHPLNVNLRIRGREVEDEWFHNSLSLYIAC
jgi:hypothetical protein